MSNPEPRDASSVQSVDRAVSALEHLARQGQAGVSEVAAVIGVHKSTASRLLGALQARGLVEATGERGRYRLGFGILRLAGAMGGRLDVTTQGREVCDELAAEVGETVNIAVRQGDQVINVHQSYGGSAITANNWVGRPTPLHATSSGKVLLAWAPEPLRDKLTATLPAFTAATLVDPAVLRQQLQTVRSDGYATTLSEYEVGLNAVAAPVFGGDGMVIAAVSVSAPAYRLPEARLPDAARAVIATAIRISERMGHLG